ncbi:MAG: arsenite methyltransferase [Spirochaetales bacterium]|nr:arsenite methyltransferase [Spirochaetales bacterium]
MKYNDKTKVTKNDNIRKHVREEYAKVVTSSNCCSQGSCCSTTGYDKTALQPGYSINEIGSVPKESNFGLGCGNPISMASLKESQTVLDLGSGAGFDCFLAARKVGPNGQVIGVDMTPEMISKARSNTEKNNYTNVEFRLGEIENLPIADNQIDVIISNCVINLSPDKLRVFQEAYRVLKKGGRLAISDIVAEKPLPAELKENMALYSGCISGASLINELEEMLHFAGFIDIKIKTNPMSKEFIKTCMQGLEKHIVSAAIEAVK